MAAEFSERRAQLQSLIENLLEIHKTTMHAGFPKNVSVNIDLVRLSLDSVSKRSELEGYDSLNYCIAAFQKIIDDITSAKGVKSVVKDFVKSKIRESRFKLIHIRDVWLGENLEIKEEVDIFSDESAFLEQTSGPRFSMEKGQIDLSSAVTAQHLINPIRVHSLLPVLRDLALDASGLFARNQAHARISTTLSKYLNALGGDEDALDFNVIAAYGVMLSNAEEAGLRDVADRLAPELEDDQKSALSSILDLHGPFILSTEAGQSFLSDAAAYDRLKEDEDLFRSASLEIAQAIKDEKIATVAAGAFLLDTVENIGEGPHPARSGVLGTNTVRNALVALVAGAVVALPVSWGFAASAGWIAAVLVAEGVKKSSVGQGAANIMRDALDDPMQRKNLSKLAPFILRHEAALRIIAGSQREFKWLNKWLDWLKENAPNAD